MPASPVNMLDTEKPNKITLLGKDLVAWFNSRGSQSWEVVEDRCPHSTEGLAMPGVIGSWTPFCEASPSLSLDGPELLQAWVCRKCLDRSHGTGYMGKSPLRGLGAGQEHETFLTSDFTLMGHCLFHDLPPGC
eukprot:scaffold78273_cov15-Tisochrysis_lutea.AAC.1